MLKCKQWGQGTKINVVNVDLTAGDGPQTQHNKLKDSMRLFEILSLDVDSTASDTANYDITASLFNFVQFGLVSFFLLFSFEILSVDNDVTDSDEAGTNRR